MQHHPGGATRSWQHPIITKRCAVTFILPNYTLGDETVSSTPHAASLTVTLARGG